MQQQSQQIVARVWEAHQLPPAWDANTTEEKQTGAHFCHSVGALSVQQRFLLWNGSVREVLGLQYCRFETRRLLYSLGQSGSRC